MSDDEPLVPMSSDLLDAFHELVFRETLRHCLSDRPLPAYVQFEDAEEVVHRALRDMYSEGLPLPEHVMDTLSERQVARAASIHRIARDSLNQDKSHDEVAERFRSWVEQGRVERRMRWWWHPMRLPDGRIVLPKLDALGNIQVPPEAGAAPGFEASKDENEEDLERLSQMLESRRMLRVVRLRYPDVLETVRRLSRYSDFLAGFYLGRSKPSGGRPGGPTPMAAARVWAVDSVTFLCGLPVRDSLQVWSTWFAEHALDDVHQFSQEKRRVATYLEGGPVDGVLSESLVEDLIPDTSRERGLEAWISHNRRRGAILLSEENPQGFVR
jgi:hypothetical protein